MGRQWVGIFALLMAVQGGQVFGQPSVKNTRGQITGTSSSSGAIGNRQRLPRGVILDEGVSIQRYGEVIAISKELIGHPPYLIAAEKASENGPRTGQYMLFETHILEMNATETWPQQWSYELVPNDRHGAGGGLNPLIMKCKVGSQYKRILVTPRPHDPILEKYLPQ